MTLLTLLGGATAVIRPSLDIPLQSAQVLLRGNGRELDISQITSKATLNTDEHGFQSARLAVDTSWELATELYGIAAGMECVISTGADLLWEGRVEDPGIQSTADGTQVNLTAYGFQVALDDALYTALWSDSGVKHWEENPGYTNEQFQVDLRNRIWVALVKSTIYVAGIYGGWQYRVPAGSTRPVRRLIADYFVYLPTNAKAQIEAFDGSTYTSPWTLVGTGAPQSGTLSVTIAAATTLYMNVLFTANYTEASETGVHFFRLINVRVLTTTTTTITAKAIIADIANQGAALNPASVMPAADSVLDDTYFDLHDETYIDQRPRAILNRISPIGNNGGAIFTWKIYEGRFIRLGLRDYADTYSAAGASIWAVDLTAVNLERVLKELVNRLTATYGDDLRTATFDDTNSQARYGMIRQGVLSAGDVPIAEANSQVTAQLSDVAEPTPRASISFDQLYTLQGAPVPIYCCRGGDRIIIRNMPPDLPEVADGYFVVSTSYELTTGKLTVNLGAPPARLEWLLNRKKEST